MVPQDQIRTRADEQAVKEGCTWDQDAADRVVRFIETFVIPKEGRKARGKFRLFAWQKDLVSRLFGWKRKDGTRRFRTGYISVARQNGKSFLCSAICLYMLLADDEQSPAVASAACSRQQAGIIYENMAYAIENNGRLANVCHLVPSRKTIKALKTNGVYQSLSVEARTSLGYSFSCVILDEYSFHPTDKLAAALKPTLAAREQPLLLAITTAGTDFTSPGYEMYSYARKVEAGVSLDTSFFSAIYEADEGADVADPQQWHKANPSLIEGTLSEAEFKDAAAAASHSKAEELQFSYFRLNRWTKGLSSYIGVDKWDACRGVLPDLRGQPLYLGLDFANSKDLTGVTGVIPYQGKLYVIAHAWAPQAAADQREKENKTRYQVFAAEGSLTLTNGNGTDYREIRKYVRDLAKVYDLKEIVADPNYANETLMELMQDGFTVYRFGQSPRNYSDPTKRLSALVLDRQLVHDGGNLLRWQIQNLQVEVSGEDYVRPAKGKSADKIDNVCALVMAISRAVGHETAYKPKKSIYEEQGLFLVG